MIKDARFYFANLASDVARCICAADEGNEERYVQSLARARTTLGYLRTAGRPEAYEEGLLLLRALAYAENPAARSIFSAAVDRLAEEFSPLVV